MNEHPHTAEALKARLAKLEAESTRSAKVQAALYKVAEAVSASEDMQHFYASLHAIVGELMFAGNFFIALRDEQSNMLTWPYHVDEKDVGEEVWEPEHLDDDRGLTGYIIRTGRSLHVAIECTTLEQRGDVTLVGARPEDGIFVPLKVGSSVLGALAVQSYTPGIGYSADDVQVLIFVAQHIATALTRARALEETRQRNAELAIINSVGEAMARTLDIKTMTRIVGDKVLEIFGCDIVSILLLERNTNLIHTVYAYDKGEGGYGDYNEPFPLGVGLTSQVIASRRGLRLGTNADQIAAGGYIAPESLEQGSGVIAESWLGVPIIMGENVLGVVSIGNYAMNAFQEAHERLLQTLSTNMGVAIENANRFETEQQRVAELQIINSIQQGLASKLDLQGVIDLVGDKLREVLKTDEIGIRLYDAETDRIHYPYEFEHGQRLTVEPLAPSGLFRTMRLERTPIFGSTDEISRRYNMAIFPGTEESKSLVAVPIISGEGVIGAIQVEDYEREEAFNEGNIRLLETIAASMGVALDNARLFDETQRLLKETEQRNAELAIINSVQEGLAAQLDYNAIIHLVGDQLQAIFHVSTVQINTYDHAGGLVQTPYCFEDGDLHSHPARPMEVVDRELIDTHEPVIVNENMLEYLRSKGLPTEPRAGRLPKSDAMVPLLAKGSVSGYVSLQDNEHEHAFTEPVVRLLSTLASSLSVALENARLFDETQRLLKETEQRAAELAIINSVQEGLASKLDLDAIIDLVGDKVGETFKSDTTYVFMYDRQTQLIRRPYYTERGHRHQLGPVPLGQGLTSIVINTRKPLLLGRSEESDALEAPGSDIESPDEEKDLNETYLGVPIIAGGDVIGVVSVQSYQQDAYSQSDVGLLQTLANAMSVALENARLFDETQRLLKETDQRAAELQIINSVQEGLASKLEMQAIYDLVGEKIRDIFQTEVVYIAMRRDDAADMIDFPYYLDRGARIYSDPVLLGEGITSQVVQRRQPLVASTMEEQLALGGIYADGEQSQSYLGVPIFVGDRVLGVASVQSYQRSAFGPAEVRLLSTLASSMGVALQNARLFDETQRLLKETEQRAAELAIINSVQEGLASKLGMQEIYDLVGERLRAIFDVGEVEIASLDTETQMISFPYWSTREGRVAADPLPLGTGLNSIIIRSRKPLILGSAQAIMDAGAVLPEGLGRRKSFVGVPVVSGTRVLGAISLHDEERENVFGDAELSLLSTLAGSLGVALENARLFDEVQRRNQEVTEALEQQTATSDILRAIASSPTDIEPVLNVISEHALRLCEATSSGIYLTDGRTISMTAVRGFTDEAIQVIQHGYPRPLERNEGYSARAILDKRILEVEDVATDADAPEIARQIAAKQGWHKAAFIPMIREGTVLGAIGVANQSPGRYSERQIHLLRTFADQAVIAIENVRLFEETQRLLKETEQRAAELSSINTVSQALVAEEDPDRMIQLVGDELMEIFDPDIAYVALLDRQSNMLDFPYQQGDEMLRMPLGQGLTSRIIETGTPLLINRDIAKRRQELGTERVGKQASSYLGVPILAGGEAIGAISVQSTYVENAFSEDDLRLLGTIAANTGAAIQTARLHTETRRRAQEMATLAEIGNDIAGTRELEPVLERIAQHAMSIMQVRDLAITLRDEEGEDYRTRVALGRYSDEMKQLVVRPGMGIMGSILQAGIPELVNDPQNDPRKVTVPGTPENEEEPECLMGAPLISRGNVIGGLMVWRTRKNGLFTQAELDFLVSVARQTTIAIESARLYLETQRRANEMSALAEVGREISASLDKAAVLELIAGRAMDLLEAENSAVFLAETDGRSMRAIAARGNAADVLRVESITVGEGIIGTLAAEGKAEFVNDVAHDARAIVVPGMNEPETERMMAAPLMRGEEVVGMLAVWRTTASFSQADLNFLIGLARQAAIAFENARLFDEVRAEKQYSEALVKNVPAAIIGIDEDTNVIAWNPGAEKLFGYLTPEALGRNIDDLIANDARIRAEALQYSDQARAGREFSTITQRSRKDRSLVDVELSAVPIRYGGDLLGNIGIFHDITELLRARHEAVAANEAKSAFLATMSHEIRTPMNAVIGMSGLLMDTPLNPEQRDYAETIRNSGDALLTIINDILDFSKIEAGKMELESQPFDLRECVESAVDLVAGRANEKKLDLAYILEDDVPPGIRGDVTRLRQILLNLVSNAVKFTEKGEVVLTVAPGREREQLLFSVRDSGIGIPKNRMDRLFASFSQADSSTTRRFGGTGLGLAISKRLAELMGGTMWAESDGQGKGATFSFTMQAPAAKVTARKTVRELNGIQPSLNGKRVLIVDDNATNRRILMLQTEKWGMAPREIERPLEALRLLKSGAAFDLAILDVQMPEMDGVTLARELRRLQNAAHLPIILLTSLGRKEAGAEDLDISAFLTKPLKPSGLFDALAGIFGRHVAAPRAEAARATIDVNFAQDHPLRILLAEDNAVNQKLALRLLEQMGYRADVASNGIEAVESVQRQTYDVVLMDVQMPEMDGLDATRTIRKITKLTQPRIVAMTANAMQGDREMCLAAGMDDYVSKPIRVAELIDALRKVPALGGKGPTHAKGKPRAAPTRKKNAKPERKAVVKAAPRGAKRSRKA